MKKNNSKDEEIDEILNSLDGINKAEAPPFFYTRLQSKMQSRPATSKMALMLSFLGQPAFALASLSLFVLLNVYAITSTVSTKKQVATTQTNAAPSLQTFADEYDLSVSTLYNDSKNK